MRPQEKQHKKRKKKLNAFNKCWLDRWLDGKRGWWQIEEELVNMQSK